MAFFKRIASNSRVKNPNPTMKQKERAKNKISPAVETVNNPIQCTVSDAVIGVHQTVVEGPQADYEDKNYIHNNYCRYRLKIKELALERGLSVSAINEALNEIYIVARKRLITDEIEMIDSCMINEDNNDAIDVLNKLGDNKKNYVMCYIDSKDLTNSQTSHIYDLYLHGYNIEKIVKMTNIIEIKVENYLIKYKLSFLGQIGIEALAIIKNTIGEIEAKELINKICSNDIVFKDKLSYQLQRKNEEEYKKLLMYFSMFEESKDFMNIKYLGLKDKQIIKDSDPQDIAQLCKTLNIVQSLIMEYVTNYEGDEEELAYLERRQAENISKILYEIGPQVIYLDQYRKIFTKSQIKALKELAIKQEKMTLSEIFFNLIPVAYYYLKCNLPFRDLANIFKGRTIGDVKISTQDIFHIIFQQSDPLLKVLCVDHYSFSNPVPFYYPTLKVYQNCEHTIEKLNFEICKEVWYSLPPFNALISFGLGKARWNHVGKSYLLNLMLKTNFEVSNANEGIFHAGSIDVQMTKNLVTGEINKEKTEAIKWAFFDCHGPTNLDIAKEMCKKLKIILVHITERDFNEQKENFEKDLINLELTHKILYIFIRDSKESKVKVKSEGNRTNIFIPNLKKVDIDYVKQDLSKIGHRILNTNIEKEYKMKRQFVETMLGKFEPMKLEELLLIKGKVDMFVDSIKSNTSKNAIEFNFLSYYPVFVKLMGYKHLESFEADSEICEKLNRDCTRQFTIIRSQKQCELIKIFNDIIKDEKSNLLLWRISQELEIYSNEINNNIIDTVRVAIEQRNDKYTLEILWREALLTGMYITPENEDFKMEYNTQLIQKFSRHVQCGEPFEVVDGDNLAFFSKEIDALLEKFYIQEKKLITEYNSDNVIKIKEAPLVLSIIGPQSSGKSTLLNYVFGCKFQTSTGRCTRGVYGSIFKLDKPINNSMSLLILDTEGLDGSERKYMQDTSKIHFDRTMVLFCLSVSQIVIINIIGDIGNEIQNLLQICAYSLSRLKVNKILIPKIYFVLNQQANPDIKSHVGTINKLIHNLNESLSVIDCQESSVTNLIEVTTENLFIIPGAFNTEEINEISGQLFDFEVTKLSPTENFAKQCAILKKSIIREIETISLGERTTFSNLSEWIQMAGTIWEVIMRYQDIVRFSNIDELKCYHKLREMIDKLIDEEKMKNQDKFEKLTVQLIKEINEDERIHDKKYLLNSKVAKIQKFDEVYSEYNDRCIECYRDKARHDHMYRKMNKLFEEMEKHLQRLLSMERQYYEDKITTQINILLTEQKITQNMKNFQDITANNIEQFIGKTNTSLKEMFEELWLECFGTENPEEELNEKIQRFDDLYSIFKVECDIIELKPRLLAFYSERGFDFDKILDYLKFELYNKFTNLKECKCPESYFFGYDQEQSNIKNMVTYNANTNYNYLEKSALFKECRKNVFNKFGKGRRKIVPQVWIPTDCIPLLKSISDLRNKHESDWGELIWSIQSKKLALSLKSIKHDGSAWADFLDDILNDIEVHFKLEKVVTPAKVKLLIQDLKYRIRLVNHELSYIWARLSNFAERGLSCLVFTKAFEYSWEAIKMHKIEDFEKQKSSKLLLEEYFVHKVRVTEMTLGPDDRDTMEQSDTNFAITFSTHFIEAVNREAKVYAKKRINEYIEKQKNQFSNQYIFEEARKKVDYEMLNVTETDIYEDSNSFVLKFICQRNLALECLFKGEWNKIAQLAHDQMSFDIEENFNNTINLVKMILVNLFEELNEKLKENNDITRFDSFYNFYLFEKDHLEEKNTQEKESPFKAMSLFLRLYLDPTVSIESFNAYFKNDFQLSKIRMKKCEDTTLVLKEKSNKLINKDFRKLINTTMFNEKIFNLYTYLNHFIQNLEDCKYSFNKDEFEKTTIQIRDHLFSSAIGCTKQCPSCGKFCEREVHNDGSRCHIKTGHQFSSMGGKVWQADEENTAVLYRCDDYTDHMVVQIPGRIIKWVDFKDMTSKEWDWNMSSKDTITKKNELNFMKNIWKNCGEKILQYHKENLGNVIKYISYDDFVETKKTIKNELIVCFVIDGTSSMSKDIQKAILSVRTLMNTFKESEIGIEYSIVIYRDHCDDKMIEIFPTSKDFTNDGNKIINFLTSVIPHGGGDPPEAVLDGLSTASKLNWSKDYGKKNMIIHIYDYPPHGDFPNYNKHDKDSDFSYCCCCSLICFLDWDRDVWGVMNKLSIYYYGISTGKKCEGFENTMEEKLGDLCEGFTVCGKEQVNDAIMKIFIQY